MMLKGTLCEVGNLHHFFAGGYISGSSGRGIRIDIDGTIVEITGLSQEECRSMVKSLNSTVTVCIEPSNEK